MLTTWWLIAFGQANEQTTALISQVYIGYRVDIVGSFIGCFWAFGGFFFAWIYNFFAKRISDNDAA